MKDYLITIRIPLKAIDDPEVRKQVKQKIENKNISLEGADIKIQEVFQDQPPRRVGL